MVYPFLETASAQLKTPLKGKKYLRRMKNEKVKPCIGINPKVAPPMVIYRLPLVSEIPGGSFFWVTGQS